MSESTPGEILTVKELSIYLKIPRATIYKLVREDKFPAQKIGRHWRFRKEAIDRWLENGRVRVSKLCGFTPEEMLEGTNSGVRPTEPSELSSGQIAARVHAFEAGDESAMAQTIEGEDICKDGSTKTIEAVTTLAKNEQGEVTEIVGVSRDISTCKHTEEMLCETEENLGTYFEHAPDGVYLSDLQGMFLYGNKRAEEITGYDREELIGKSFLKLNILPKMSLVKAGKLLALNTMGRPTGPDEFELVRKDGTPLLVEINTAPIKQREKVVVLGFVRDITVRKQAEQALEESKSKYKALANSISDVFFAFDTDLRYTFWNRASETLTGISAQDAIGKTIFDIFPDTEDTRRAVAVYRDVLATHRPKSFINEYYYKGEHFFFEISAYPSEYGLTVFTKDVTRQREIESSLQESEERFRSISENMQGGILLFEHGKGTYANNRASDILGYSRNELLNIDLSDISMTEEESPLIRIPYEIQKSADTGDIDCWIARKDGERRYIHLRYSYLHHDNQRKIFLIVINDMTELKLAEMKLQNLYEEERGLREKLENEIKKRIEFTHALVHELKTPLTPVMTCSEMLVRAISEGIASRLARNVYDGAVDLDKRINELLELARMEVGTFKLTLKPTDPLALIRDTVNYITPTVSKNNRVIRAYLPESLPIISADPDRLGQVLLNIIDNALKYTPSGSEIVVSTRQEDVNIIVEVKDNGKGMSEELQQRLFQPYSRIVSDREILSGLGLGLHISKNIVELHGGQIWVKSKVDAGTTVGFSIPITGLMASQEGSKP